ncbi:MAG: tetratricopeptide repeat protein [Planctomycetes bacterium]|nr:tetratricopeptide repeat protein [Planctomycetota bacterium]
MSELDSGSAPSATLTTTADGTALWEKVRVYFEARDQLRRGLCLLSAGQYAHAADRFRAVGDVDLAGVSLASYLAMCLVGDGKYAEAAVEFERAADLTPHATLARIRQSLALWRAGNGSQAVAVLRDAVGDDAECAELHFQLGTLLAARGETDEAELRFTQTIALDTGHKEAHTALAMCYGVREQPGEAVRYLKRAQHLRPADAKIALLLTMAAQASAEEGKQANIQVEMPDLETEDTNCLTQLGDLIAAEPEFLESFLDLPETESEREIFGLLGKAVELALDGEPNSAALHYGRARVLERLGRPLEAINAIERAVQIDSRFVRALIHLGKLYQQTDQADDARQRLEQAITLGADYADVYFLLGNLYRDGGERERARQAYRSALRINGDYTAAKNALQSLAA